MVLVLYKHQGKTLYTLSGSLSYYQFIQLDFLASPASDICVWINVKLWSDSPRVLFPDDCHKSYVEVLLSLNFKTGNILMKSTPKYLAVCP